MDLDQMRIVFDSKISALLRNKREDNKAFLNSDEYAARVKSVKHSKMVLHTPGAKKNTKDYRTVSRYDVLTINGEERLIKPMSETTKHVIYFVTNEKLFDILHSAHLTIGHGGRNRMVSELKTRYANITTEAVMAYLELCAECQKKSKKLLSKPSAFNASVQSNRWTVGQVEALIDQYKKYPVLYDSNHAESDNTGLKSACLANIVAALDSVRWGVSEGEITSQWNNLVTKYSQAAHPHNSDNREPQFWYMQKLQFLRDYIRTSDVKLEDSGCVDFDDSSLFEPEITTRTHDHDGVDPLGVKEETEDASPAKRARGNEEDESAEARGSREDESDVFGKFVASQLRKITDEEVKQDTIFEIHKVLHKALKKK